MPTGKAVAEAMDENGMPAQGEPELSRIAVETGVEPAALEPRPIAVPPKAREELKALLRLQNETQERVRLVLATLEEALDVPAGWVIRDVDEGFVELRAE